MGLTPKPSSELRRAKRFDCDQELNLRHQGGESTAIMRNISQFGCLLEVSSKVVETFKPQILQQDPNNKLEVGIDFSDNEGAHVRTPARIVYYRRVAQNAFYLGCELNPKTPKQHLAICAQLDSITGSAL
ncbi:PilZ domain-containing protein [Alginatibacterium sediminis]|uniref:PilZ domain-containing protein n=1 Tax=Alginatibacterium sediminis TaxID=2164068 RepID=A0A420EMY6_9ALTE|nr:PilZ domain-containing protein [Alginatibacterium sediminis]RKF22085.1 PilZ domain-containing protein [Alginatibacterium sediminis]